MLKKLLLSLIIIIALVFNYSNNNSFAYDDKTTHPALTDEIVDFYNLSFSNNQLTNQEKEWVVQGAILEDTPPRWINHFYDPIYKIGWTGEKAGRISPSTMISLATAGLFTENPISAVSWVNNNLIQQKYSRYGGDRTWKKGLEYYASGNKEEAYKTLGYALHLLEDQSVPDHTRNDTHAHELEKETGDYGSPYEEYLKKYTRQNIKKDLDIANNLKKENQSPIIKQSIEDYLISLATYSNNYFFSKDTINDPKYQNPKIIRDDGNFGYGKDENGKEFILAIIDTISENNKSKKIYSILDGEEYYPIIDAYFSRLSRQAVIHGAGAIDLFRKQAQDAIVNKEYQTTVLKYNFSKFNIPAISLVGEGYKLWNNTVSFFAQTVSTINNITASIGNYFYGQSDNQNFQPAGQVSLTETQTSNINNQLLENPLSNNQPLTINTQQINQAPRSVAIITNQIQEEADNEIIQKPQIQPSQQIKSTTTIAAIIATTTAITNNLQPITPKQCSFTTTQSPSHSKIIINEVAWMGGSSDFGLTATDEWFELKNISNSEVNLNGWQIIDKSEKIKITFDKATKIPTNGFYLLERMNDNSVPSVSANLIYSGTLNNSDEGLRLFDHQCNLIDEVLTAGSPSLWPAGDNDQKRTMERSSDLSWHTYNGIAQNSIFGTPKKENSALMIVYNGGGGGGSSFVQQQATTNSTNSTSSPAKILISEVQITGGDGKTENDFIELYNPNNFQVNLNGYRLVKRTETGASDTGVKSWTSDAYISANGYYLWTNSGYTDISTTPDATTTITVSNNNGVALRFGDRDTGIIIDSVAWGEAQNNFIETAVFPTNPTANQSIQRKFQNPSASSGQATFIDTDNNAQDFEIQTCPSPKTQTCQSAQTNQAPSAFFVYAPSNPQVGDLITFNAASSSDPNPDGQITSYQWDFGDNATSSISTATTTHSYSTAGIYTTSLIVHDNQNASSTATSTIILVASSTPQLLEVNHLVISEIMAGNGVGRSNEEFIELYNPTDETISLDGWSLKRKTSQNSTSTINLVSNFSATSTIAAKSFFLIAHSEYLNYSTSTLPDFFYTNTSNPLAYNNDVVILYNNSGEIIDEVAYQDIEAGQSLERQAYSNNDHCISAGNDGEFLGNACDTDNAVDFEIRNTPKPQNSSNFPEPRINPTAPENFDIQYDSSAMELNLNWDISSDYNGDDSTLTYKIIDISNTSSTLSTIETASTTAKVSINEIGQDYNFFVQAFDKDGLGSATSTASTTTPSFFSGLYFYQDPRDASKNLIETYYNQYPFVPNLYYNPPNSSWKLLVFYLNSDAEKQSNVDNFRDYQPNNIQNILAIKYKQCSGGGITQKNSLLLPDISSRCGTEGGAQNIGFVFTELEDNHFIIQTASSSQELILTDQNYLTVAFYSTYSIGVGPIPSFQLVAVDKTKYYFGNSAQQSPQLNGAITLNFDKPNSRLNIDWPKATDADTLDSLLTYEIKYASSADWQTLSGNATSTTKIVSAGDNLSISVRAKDDFGNYSSSLTTDWFYPPTIFYITQTATSSWDTNNTSYCYGCFGRKDGNGNATVSLQSITPAETFNFNKVVLRIKHTVGNDNANLKLAIYPHNATSSQPDFNNIISSATLSNISGNPENDLTFSFTNPITISAGNKYWLVLEAEGYNYAAWQSNSWQNAISENNPYAGGEIGKTTINNNYSNVSVDSNADWYMKIGLEQ